MSIRNEVSVVAPDGVGSQSGQDMASALNQIKEIGPNEIAIPSFAFSLIFASDKRSVIFSTGNGIGIADRNLKEVTKLSKFSDVPASALAYSEHASLFYLGDRRGNFFIVNSQTMKLEEKVQLFKANVHKLIINFDETLLYASLASSEVVSVDISNLNIKVLYNHEEVAAMLLSLSKDGELLLSGSEKFFKIYSVMKENVLKVVALDDFKISSLALNEDNDRVAVGDTEGNVHVWDMVSWEETIYKGHAKDVSGLVFGPGFLVSASNDHTVRIWNLTRSTNPVVIETVGQVTSVSIFEDFLFYACPNLITFIKTPKLPNEFKVKAHSRDITGMAYSTKKKVLATFTSGDKIVKLWNTEKTESLFCIKELENEIGIFCLCLSGDQRHLYVSLVNKSIKKWNLDDFNCESFASGDYIANSMICSPDNRFLISIDNNSKCFVRNTSDGSISMSFTHHKMGGIGVTVTHLSNILLTLGSDHSILLYNLGLGKKIGKMEGFTSEGVKMKVSIDDRLLALTTLEEGLFIWSIEKQSLLMHKKILNTKCSEVVFTQDNQNLILQTFNIDGSRYFFYSLTGFELLFSITSDRQSMSMSLISDEKMIVCGEDSFLYLRENPLKLETFSVVGPTTKYPVKYFKYITELDSGERQDYIEDMNNFVITPSLLGTLHFYAYKNLTIHLEKALKSGFNPFLSRNSSEIMSISLEKFFVDSVGIILRQVVEDLKTNPYAACYLENCLSRLTRESHAELEDFYKTLMFIPNDKSLPKFSSYQNTFFKSQYFEILPKTMVVESNYEKSVKFYQSGVRVSCDVGGSDSIQYLENLLKTGNNEIFRSKFVEALLMEKWKEIRWFAELYAALYLSYLVVLALFTLKNENGFIVVMVLQNVLLALYEVYQLGVTRVDYFKDTLNLVDLARFLIFIVYFSLGAQVKQLLFFLNMASWFRGISHFRVFTSTRYLVNLLIEVVKDICPFLILLFYFTLGFTFMMLSLQENQSYSNFTQISETYLLNFGDFSMNDTSGSWEWLCFVISSIVNFLVMVNLLISIIGDTYDKVQAFRQIADRREMTQIILEIEYLMIWRRNNNTKSFVHIIKEDSLNQEEDFWEGKVKVLQDAITSINDTISAQNSETERKLLTITSEISEIKAGITKLLNSKS